MFLKLLSFIILSRQNITHFDIESQFYVIRHKAESTHHASLFHLFQSLEHVTTDIKNGRSTFEEIYTLPKKKRNMYFKFLSDKKIESKYLRHCMNILIIYIMIVFV